MVLKFVEKNRHTVHEYPFPNDTHRMYGWGNVERMTGVDDITIVHVDQGDECRMAIVGTLLSAYDGTQYYRFFTYYDHEEEAHTFAWLPKDYDAYVENDDGRTVNKL